MFDSHSPRLDLEALRAEDLHAIASNEAAVHKDLALRILVERGSLFAVKDDLYAAAQELILDNPIILKKVDPASGVVALKLPGIIDILADLQARRIALTRTVAEHNEAHKQSIASLEETVSIHKDAADLALRTAYSVLWKDATTKLFALKTEHDTAIAELRAAHDTQIADAKARLALLERSVWKKVSDWLRARWARLRKRKADPAPTQPEDDAMFTERVAEMVRRA